MTSHHSLALLVGQYYRKARWSLQDAREAFDMLQYCETPGEREHWTLVAVHRLLEADAWRDLARTARSRTP